MRPSFMQVAGDAQGPPPALCLLLDDEATTFVLADAFKAIRRAELDTAPPETNETQVLCSLQEQRASVKSS